MRLAAQAKMGYYPAHRDAIAALCEHLFLGPRKSDGVNILDPCAGEGSAIRQAADALGVPMSATYAVELDGGRVEKCRENLPEGNVLGPATFLGTRITYQAFGLAYVNPPFDDELGGGRREEMSFAVRATQLLVPGGVLALVVPLTALCGNRKFCEFLDGNYEGIRVFQFPAHCRPYHEIVVLARKRKNEIPTEAIYAHGDLHKMEFQWRGYGWEDRLPIIGMTGPYPSYYRGNRGPDLPPGLFEVPSSWKPTSFRKITYTDAELAEAIVRSPLQAILREMPPAQARRPPLPLGKGHVALLLASGMLDGVVQTPYGPHVVRGTAKKVEFISERSSTENPETGAVTEKVVYSEKIQLVIRAVASDGQIRTFGEDRPADAEGDGAVDEGEEEAA